MAKQPRQGKDDVILKAAIGRRLRALREFFGLSQDEFAEKIGMKRITYAKYESGERYPSPLNMIRLCDVFLVDFNWIFTNDDSCFKGDRRESIRRLLESQTPRSVEQK